MASTRVSIADARKKFAGLIKRAEDGEASEITRRGEPVAVIISAAGYRAITEAPASFIEATRKVRKRMDVEALGIGDDVFDDLRDDSPDRAISI